MKSDSSIDRKQLQRDLLSKGCIATILDARFDLSVQQHMSSGDFSGNLSGAVLSDVAVGSFAGLPVLRALHNVGDLSLERTQEVHQNISLSLSNHMRAYAPRQGFGGGLLQNATSPALGVAHTERTCVRVAWSWLVLPAFLVVATLVFAIVVHIGAGRQLRPEASTCRSSPLSLMLAGPASADHEEPPIPGMVEDQASDCNVSPLVPVLAEFTALCNGVRRPGCRSGSDCGAKTITSAVDA
jgi:hypothetical protein